MPVTNKRDFNGIARDPERANLLFETFESESGRKVHVPTVTIGDRAEYLMSKMLDNPYFEPDLADITNGIDAKHTLGVLIMAEKLLVDREVRLVHPFAD